ncbi:cytochrome d ubiquinol oxidase subunit II [candidate division KSB1 bacterium]|nr:cytochrome d ubiquinol oxidase subunit II [candidate division KSB1 bacterium]
MNFSLDLNTVWYLLVGVLLSGYAILDGFDLGVGTLYLFNKKEKERRLLLNAIGPVWDGNEVWLITGGGALFAAFPEVYATVFSGFYIAFMLLLFCLIFRATAIEFRSKLEMNWWKKVWDTSFSISSTVAALLVGVALGNIIAGIPLDQNHDFTGSFFSLLNPYAIIVGITTTILFALHGGLFAAVKTEDELQQRMAGYAKKLFWIVIFLYVIINIYTFTAFDRLTTNLLNRPYLFLILALNLYFLVGIYRQLKKTAFKRALLFSALNILSWFILFGLDHFPQLVYNTANPDNSLNIYNAASSSKTLTIMLIIAIIGFPLVLFYTTFIYKTFGGKVKLDSSSY